MTEGPEGTQPDPNAQPPAQQPAWGQPPAGQPYAQPGQPAYGQPVAGAPYGIDPKTGIPFSDKSKIIAGILQILLPFGIGRFYIGDTKTGVWQLVVAVVTCGIGSIWSWIDGILILVGDKTDPQGRPLRG